MIWTGPTLAKNLAFEDPPFLKFHNQNDINRHIKDSQVKKETTEGCYCGDAVHSDAFLTVSV